MNTDELRALLDFTAGLARDAGEITLRSFRGEYQTRLKGKDDYVTEADLETEIFIRSRLKERFPEDAIVGEEGAEQEGSTGRRWIIDPIDGTFSFVHAVPLYGVLIGLEVNGESVLGVVNLPALGEIVSAAKGVGCFWNNSRARVSQTRKLSDALLLATDFGTCERHGFGAAAEELQRSASSRRTWGDCYGYVLVATGRADVMIDPVLSIWDCAPLLPILEEAGGTFTDWRGERTILTGNAVATNGLLYEEVMSIIEKNT